MVRVYDSIIIGAGISGIGCANNFLKNDYKDFKIISPDIGGRIMESDSGTVEYGAYYIMDIYQNVKSFVKTKRKMTKSKLMFHYKNKSYGVYNKRILTHFFELLKLIMILYKFKRHYKIFKEKCFLRSQVNCLKDDEYLWNLYNKNAKDFVKEKGLEGVIYEYMAEIIHGSGFTPVQNLNAFTLLHFSLPLIVPVREFVFRKEKARKLIEKYYVNSIATNIKKGTESYEITTEEEKFYCKNLVIATPPHVSEKLIKIKGGLRGPVGAHMYHLIGETRQDWSGAEYNLFEDKSFMLAIARQQDNSYLFYSSQKNPNFKKYFFNYKILKHKHWDPAFNIRGSNLVDFNQGKNLYMIGDNNICGIEPNYIYGTYCANKILGKTED
jgi:hypothetical protein